MTPLPLGGRRAGLPFSSNSKLLKTTSHPFELFTHRRSHQMDRSRHVGFEAEAEPSGHSFGGLMRHGSRFQNAAACGGGRARLRPGEPVAVKGPATGNTRLVFNIAAQCSWSSGSRIQTIVPSPPVATTLYPYPNSKASSQNRHSAPFQVLQFLVYFLEAPTLAMHHHSSAAVVKARLGYNKPPEFEIE